MKVPSLVGYTSSNKPIYQFDSKEIELVTKFAFEFSNKDNFDARALFSYLQLFYWRWYGENSEEYNSGRVMLEFYEARISYEYIKKRKLELGLATAFDLSNYGRKHCVPDLQELIGS